MTDKPPTEGPQKSQHVDRIYWTTVTYKTVITYAFLSVVLVGVVTYLIAPDWVTGLARKLSSSMSGEGTVAVPLIDQARFVNLDGRVQVKKVNSVTWVSANPQMTLEKGDLIQTGSDGLARVVFPDGTTYTVKSDTLITVEESSVSQDRKTRVSVNISSGAVDLATGSFEAGSSAAVSFENARASLERNTRAAVRSDPNSNQHEITITAGQGDLDRGGQRIELGQYDRVSFPTGGPITRSRVLAPPALVSPRILEPLVRENPKQTPITFEWQPVQDAVQYRLRVSRSKMFSQLVAEKTVAGTRLQVTGLDPGEYFWHVIAYDAQRRASEPSDTFNFTLAAKTGGFDMLLEIEATQLHGNSVEIIGRTEPGSVLLINGQPVSNIGSDGRFRYFTPPLPKGSQEIVITGQNRRGGTAIRRIPIVIR
jgi:hypothetical protein